MGTDVPVLDGGLVILQEVFISSASKFNS
jgi:hypothetical protein